MKEKNWSRVSKKLLLEYQESVNIVLHRVENATLLLAESLVSSATLWVGSVMTFLLVVSTGV